MPLRGPEMTILRNPGLERENGAKPAVIDLTGHDPDPAHTEREASCKNEVLIVFPDICPDYLAQLAIQHSHRPDRVLSAILDKQEDTGSYPLRTSPEANPLKRKRANGPAHGLGDNDEEIPESENRGDPECVRSIKLRISEERYSRIIESDKYTALARALLGQEFPRVPQSYIRASLQPRDGVPDRSIFDVYTTIDNLLRLPDGTNRPWRDKKNSTKPNPEYAPERIKSIDTSTYKPEEKAALAEFVAAREFRAIKDARIAAEAEKQNNILRAKQDGQTAECGTCFEEGPLNRMVRCEGEIMHWFCRTCLRTQAETLIGTAKYELTCMSLDGCAAGFSRNQKALFLNDKLTVALERIEQEAMLRMAGIENLETCPFCSYAAEYPAVELAKEFRCENPKCGLVSCRLCRRKTHIPKTCAESDADRGLNARHIVEEAMSEALIRRCNKCQNAFVKIDGCNKVRCTKCGTTQCDVCRKTVTDYSHFKNYPNGGSEPGFCPLYDQSIRRYEKEVSNAESEMREKIVAEDPDLDEKILHIPNSASTHRDAGTQKAPVPAVHRLLPVHPVAPLGNARNVQFGVPPMNFRDMGRPMDGVGNLHPAIRPLRPPHIAPGNERVGSLPPLGTLQTPDPQARTFNAIMDRVETLARHGGAKPAPEVAEQPNGVGRPGPFANIPLPAPLQYQRSRAQQAQRQSLRFPPKDPFLGAPGNVND